MGSALKSELITYAQSLGFARVGVARAEPLALEGERLREWIATGRQGTMSWMTDTAEVRIDPTHEKMLPGAQSVVVLVAPYLEPHERTRNSDITVAKYAQRRDYHHVVSRNVQRVSRWLKARGHKSRGGTDLLPIFERAWAERSGVGFIGKNCMLIVPGIGSHVFLGCVITHAELEPDAPMKERCGTCTRCLEACPTQAFVAPRMLDARRCISYLTIESKGDVPPELEQKMGPRIFGCDACQDVCPFNHGQPTRVFPGLEHSGAPTLEELSVLAESAVRDRVAGTPMTRTTISRMQTFARRKLRVVP